jgi:hypothetical protein
LINELIALHSFFILQFEQIQFLIWFYFFGHKITCRQMLCALKLLSSRCYEFARIRQYWRLESISSLSVTATQFLPDGPVFNPSEENRQIKIDLGIFVAFQIADDLGQHFADRTLPRIPVMGGLRLNDALLLACLAPSRYQKRSSCRLRDSKPERQRLEKWPRSGRVYSNKLIVITP